MNVVKTYDCYLSFPLLETSKQEVIRGIFADESLDVDVGESWLEFAFTGKDSGDRVIACFRAASGILGAADGELRCEIDDDAEPDPRFAFYTIRDFHLWRQKAKIVRDEVVEEV